MFFPLHLFCPFLSVSILLLLHNVCIFLSRLLHHLFSCLFFNCILLSSPLHNTPVCLRHLLQPLILSALLPRLRSLMNIKRRARLFTLFVGLQTLCFLHFFKPHSCYFVHLFLFQTACFPCNYFPMNIRSPVAQCMFVCVYVYVCVCVRTPNFMSSFTNT